MQQDYLQIRVLEVAPQVLVSGQLFAADLGLLAKQGVRTIVDNRTDADMEGQPSAADLAGVAEEHGMSYVHFPVPPGSISSADVEAFATLCEELERPLHIFGRSAGPSIKIWEMAESP